ncbi:metallophosphoesterase [Acinetobacter variabilis]|uniref:metallophosphoesterase n=1 Tax=Acinetobacter variabilis TaxID=70346 RepID=UPI0021CDA05E|nr:metallophosphoesterase [Acinetobacter variabilis]MCU4366650.1 metallophosphoesterase [Acinetobacter variabilis]
MALVKIWDNEIKGKLWAVGDIHGCYNLLMTRLKEIGFDFENDLLVAVGDLVDRGTQNIECIELLSKPWFTSVRGNHEDLCIGGLHNESYKRCHVANGGEWFYMLDGQAMYSIAKTFAELPVVLEVNRNGKKYGFVHGHIEQNNWDEFKETFTQEPTAFRDPSELAMWGRDRLDEDKKQYTHVSGIDAVIMGHTVTQKPCKRDNCYWIDTGAVHWGTMTILDLSKI